MISPSKCYSKETLSEILQVPVKKRTGSRRWARLPADVLGDPKLASGAKLVYQAMDMEAYGCGEIAISHEGLAGLTGLSRPTVLHSLKMLASGGFIEMLGRPLRQVQPYRLLHPQFQRKAATEILEAKIARRAVMVACKSCGAFCKRLPKARICGTCLRRADIQNTAARVAHRVAMDVVDERLPKVAS